MITRMVVLVAALIAPAFCLADDTGKGEAERGYLGVSVLPLDEKKLEMVKSATSGKDKKTKKQMEALRPGLLIQGMMKDSPAHKAGMQIGDIVLVLNGKSVDDDLAAVQKAMQKTRVGKKVKIKYLRIEEDGSSKEVEASLDPVSKEEIDKLKPLPLVAEGGGAKPKKTKIADNFDGVSGEETPEGWKNRRLGEGKLAKWQVIEEEGAPSGKNVLAIIEPANAAGTWNLCIDEEVSFSDDCISAVKIKAESGDAAMGGGLVFNYQDKKNFYAVILDFKTKEAAMYKVANGTPELLTTTEGKPAKVTVDIKPGKWHLLQCERMPTRILVRMDGEVKPILDARDKTFRGGKVGVVAPADAVTKFDSLTAEPPKRPMGR